MTLFPRNMETEMGIDTSEGVDGLELLEVGDIMSQGVANIVVSGDPAPHLYELSEKHTVTHIGDFKGAETFYFGPDSLGNGGDTMYMG